MAGQKNKLLPLDICRLSRPAIDNILNLPEFISASSMYIYMEYNQEIITHPIMSKAWEMGKRVAVPKILDKKMNFYYIESFDDVISGYKGILEPLNDVIAEEEQALVIMPGLAFDREFNRIGYGGGFYDNFFNTHKGSDYIKVGLCYDFQVMDHFDKDAHDVPVDIIVTPSAVFRKNS